MDNSGFLGLTPDDAKYLLGFFGVVVTLSIAWLPTIKIPDYQKFGILALFSLVGGFLTVVSTNQFINGGSIIQNAALVLTAAQAFYYTAFRVLGLERVLFPKQAVATEVKEQAKDTVPETLTTARAKDLLDPNTPATLQVTTQVINTPVGDPK